MKKWTEYHAERRLNEGAEDLIVKAYHAMQPADKEKINRVLASATWGEQWMNLMRTVLAGKDNLPIEKLIPIVLDGIDTYLRSDVTNNPQNSDRIQMAQTQRRAPGMTAPGAAAGPRADYQGNFGKTQTLWGSKEAKHGDVPQQEIAAKRLNQYHHDVYDGPGGLATAPSSYKYVWNRLNKKIVYNPNYQG